MKKPRISYRDWLNREPKPPNAEMPVAAVANAEVANAEADIAETAVAETTFAETTFAETAIAEATIAEAPEIAESSEPVVVAVAAAAPDTLAVEHLVFRVGRELFALPLDNVEEAIDIDHVQRIPEMAATMLGVLPLRGTMVPLYAPSVPLGVHAETHRAALIFVMPRGRVALAVDDVDDVLVISPDEIQRSPLDFGDGVLVGVTRRGADLIGVLDATALVAACRAEPVLESA